MFQSILQQYEVEFPEETSRLSQFKDVLDQTNIERLLSRKNFVGHITASGILIWRSKSKVLLMKHAGLADFFQPGGHFERDSDTPLEVAKRHVAKALGNSSFAHFPIHSDPNIPIDIDTHLIPPREELGESDHFHYDFRYLFILNEPNDIKDSATDGMRWENINQLLHRTSFKVLVPKIIKRLSEVHTRSFFDEITSPLRALPDQVSCLAVAHVIPDIYPYIHAIQQSFHVLGIIPKPNSIDSRVEKELLRSSIRMIRMKREEIKKSPKEIFDLTDTTKNKFILIDIGGYFAEIVNDLAAHAGPRFVGVIEDTENGQQKYESAATNSPLQVPVVSVARSPLKANEDFLVGQSVLFSTDFVLRQVGSLVQYMQCAVVGYGKLGSSIAHHLLLRGVKPWVYDDNPIQRAKAVNQLCNAPPRQYIIKNADVIFCATGKKSLNIFDFRNLKSGSFVVSVTSSDDELDLTYLRGEYKAEPVDESNHVTKYSSFTNFFYLINEGNAVNFIHNAVLGNWIHLVRGEMLHAAGYLLKNNLPVGLSELKDPERKCVAEKWLKVFVDDQSAYNNC